MKNPALEALDKLGITGRKLDPENERAIGTVRAVRVIPSVEPDKSTPIGTVGSRSGKVADVALVPGPDTGFHLPGGLYGTPPEASAS